MLRALVTSDWHFESLKRLFPENHLDLQLQQLQKIYDYAISNGISHIFVPGDIADVPHMEWSTYIKLVTFLKKYDGHIHTYYVAGNHDFSDIKKTSLDLLKVLLDNKFFKTFNLYLNHNDTKIEGVPVAFHPYPLHTIDPSKHLHFAHITVQGAVGDNGYIIKDSEHVYNHPNKGFVISGHIHQYQSSEKKRLIYCGNPYQKTFGECEQKGFIEIKAVCEKKVYVKHKQVILKPNYKLVTKDIATLDDLTSLSQSPRVKYRLRLVDDIVMPSDFRLHYPNVHTIMDNRNKQITLETEDSERSISSITINPLNGLSKALKTTGIGKKERIFAKHLVLEALDHLKIKF